jgi:hypothetical protein
LWDHLGAYIGTKTPGFRETPLGQRNLYLGQKLLPEPNAEALNANETIEDNCRTEDDLPPLAQDLSEQAEDVNMNHPDGCVSFVKDQNGLNHARFSWTGLDTAELVQNAQKLLQSVSVRILLVYIYPSHSIMSENIYIIYIYIYIFISIYRIMSH